MDSLNYILKIKNNDKLVVRNLILAVCAVALAVVVIGVIACLGNKTYMNLVYYSIALVVIIAIQFSTTFLCYELIIKYENGKIIIVKSFYGKKKLVLDAYVKDIAIEKFTETYEEKIIALCSKCCDLERYVLKLSGRNYLLNLDDYMYSLIEVGNDIS
ncbi:MAG: hypothetical protein K2J89_04240 [Clostridia bacterium]|nr:hypothetical protein [Clostridia bacterium]